MLAKPQFTGKNFPGASFDETLPIPASLHDLMCKPIHELRGVKIAIIGEALGENEELQGRPFVGSTGADLRIFAKQAGFKAVQRGFFQNRPFYELPNIYIDNVVKVRPLENNLKHLPVGALDFWTYVLHQQFSCGVLLPNVIIAVGGVALKALCGTQYEKITQWRGSILETQFVVKGEEREEREEERKIKVIPTLHPSYIQENWHLRYQVISDLHRALEESQFPERKLPSYTFITRPSLAEIKDYADEVNILAEKHKDEISAGVESFSTDFCEYSIYTKPQAPAYLACDIETQPPFLRTIGFSLDGKTSICIPFTHDDLTDYWLDRDEEAKVWTFVYQILNSTIPKIGQNFVTYDMYCLTWYGFRVRNFWLDTLYAHKALHPELPASLQLLTSLYTSQPFYKDEGKKKSKGYTEDGFFQYNCLDTLVNIPIALTIRDSLVKAKLWDVYVEEYLRMYPPLHQMQLRGIRFNEAWRRELREVYAWVIDGLQQHLNKLIGYEVNTSSPKQMKTLLYEKLGIALMFTGVGTDKKVTTNANALYRARKNYKRHEAVMSTLLLLRKVKTRASSFIEARVDEDGRIRAEFNLRPETGRLASAENPLGTGRNLQNLERVSSKEKDNKYLNMRNLLVVDKRKSESESESDLWIIEADYRQAEAQAVAWMANEEKLITIFKSGQDIHLIIAMVIFNCTAEYVTTERRYQGKQTSHSANYDVGPSTLVDTFIKNTEGMMFVTVKQARTWLETYHASFPNIRLVFHTTIKQELDASMTLWTVPPFNRRRVFFGRYGDVRTYHEGYAAIPQSVVVGACNLAFRRLHRQNYDVMLQAHDALYLQCERKDLPKVFTAVKQAMHIPIDFHARYPRAYAEPLIIPTDISVGKKVGALMEFKHKSDEEILDCLHTITDRTLEDQGISTRIEDDEVVGK